MADKELARNSVEAVQAHAGYGVTESEVSSVLRNTYMLLGMTLAFSALVAFFSMSMGLPRPGLIVTLVGFYGLLFAIHKTQNSGMGLVFTFALTGFMGYTLGPILSAYLVCRLLLEKKNINSAAVRLVEPIRPLLRALLPTPRTLLRNHRVPLSPPPEQSTSTVPL